MRNSLMHTQAEEEQNDPWESRSPVITYESAKDVLLIPNLKST